ncbi:MAG: SDR family NAD(P)-dependent oxidoreductase [Candidatus Latescibacteria bacterium]|nr:SDR family NAD(P)-dependent oxidoreductase [Candidatus Latescibacterota bacterium]
MAGIEPNSALKGKVAVVTGASRGLGRQVALALAAQGAAVALVARGEAALKQVEAQLRQAGHQALALPADVTQAHQVETLKEKVQDQLGIPAILINAAGIFGPIQLIANSDPEAWVQTIQINTVAPYLTCRAFMGGMIAQGWGRIVNFTSAAALHPPGPLNSAYGTSKVALNQFTRHLAAELEGSGVTANVMHPGDVKTEMWADIRDQANAMGPEAEAYRQWVKWVEQTGGDDPAKAARRVLQLMGEQTNGRFLWIEAPLQAPIPSWGEIEGQQPWKK